MSSPNSSQQLIFRSGHSSEQGVRPTMEDEVIIQENFSAPLPSQSSGSIDYQYAGPFSLYGVFDGHGGRDAAVFTRDHIHGFLLDELQKPEGRLDPPVALIQAYIKTDALFISSCRGETCKYDELCPPPPNAYNNPAALNYSSKLSANAPNSVYHTHHNQSHDANNTNNNKPCTNLVSPHTGKNLSPLIGNTSGTTAVCVLIEHSTGTMWVANVGDSRAVFCKKDGEVLALTNDHKADRPDEVQRIRQAGGFVVHKRVMGELAISRAIGDLDFKDRGFAVVLSYPEIHGPQPLRSGDEFILLACDGLFDVMTNEVACEFIRERLQPFHLHEANQVQDKNTIVNGKMSVQLVCEKLTERAIKDLFTRDNVTCVIVQLPSSFSVKSTNPSNSSSSTTETTTKPTTDDTTTAAAPATTNTTTQHASSSSTNSSHHNASSDHAAGSDDEIDDFHPTIHDDESDVIADLDDEGNPIVLKS